LADAYLNSLELAVSKALRSIAFPSISTGAYRYPLENASKIALDTVKSFLESRDDLDELVFVLFKEDDLKVYQESAGQILSGGSH
jgi:O-acetyl-ADP-ribose deacetylase (regulator of RNase III)